MCNPIHSQTLVTMKKLILTSIAIICLASTSNAYYCGGGGYYRGGGGWCGGGGYYRGGGGYYRGGYCGGGGWYGTGIPNGLGWTLFGLGCVGALSAPVYYAPPVQYVQPQPVIINNY